MWRKNKLKSINRIASVSSSSIRARELASRTSVWEMRRKEPCSSPTNGGSKRYAYAKAVSPFKVAERMENDMRGWSAIGWSGLSTAYYLNLSGSHWGSSVEFRSAAPEEDAAGRPGRLNPPLPRSPFHPLLLNGGRMNQCQTHARCGLFSLFPPAVLLHYPSVSRGPPTRVRSTCT